MPFINVSVGGTALSDTQKQRIFDETTRLMGQVLKKDRGLTAVRIDQPSAADWAVGGRTVAERGESGVHVDVKITRGTNTDAEKAAFIRQEMAMLKDVIGAMPEASYIVIHELDASSWDTMARPNISGRKLESWLHRRHAAGRNVAGPGRDRP